MSLQSTRSTSRPCSRCRQKIEVACEVEAGESGTITIDEVNHFSSSLSNAVMCFDSSKSSSLPANASPAHAAILCGGSDGTESSVSPNDIPIPIFTSSQYSIQRRRTRSTPRSSRQDERRPPTSSPNGIRTRRQNLSTVRVFSTDCGNNVLIY